jgi:hypothetical protein
MYVLKIGRRGGRGEGVKEIGLREEDMTEKETSVDGIKLSF